MLQTGEQKCTAQLATLIYSSGENNLNYLFSNQAQAYLNSALNAAEGQFGFSNQQIIKHRSDIVACASCWTTDIPKQYHAATLKSLIYFFGAEKTVSILQKSSILAELLSAPQHNELGIGHFAVAKKSRRQGFGKALLDYYLDIAKQQNKAFLVLDVAADNQPALNFYYEYGFQLANTIVPNQKATTARLNTHLHLRFAI